MPAWGCIGSSSVIHYSLHKTSLASGGKTTPKQLCWLRASCLGLHYCTDMNLKQL